MPRWRRGLRVGVALAAIVGSRGVARESPSTEMSVAELGDRIRALETMNRALLEQLERTQQNAEATRRAHDAQMRQLLQRVEQIANRSTEGVVPAAMPPQEMAPPPLPSMSTEETGPIPSYETQPIEPSPAPSLSPLLGLEPPPPEYMGPVPAYETQPIEPNPFRSGAPGLSTIASPDRARLESNFGPGFQFQTLDEEFLLQIHLQSQIETRIWGDPNGGAPFRNGFYFPRQRIYFNGRITRPLEYSFSINRGLGELNILETYLNYHPDDRFQVRFGRYFTPLGFDQFAIRNLWLPTPERSLFTTNLGPNRQLGLMAWGYLLDKRLDYAAGIFTGPRNSFEDTNNAKDFTGFLNARPFQNSERFAFLRDWNIGTSVVTGRQDQPAVPLMFRIGAVAPTNASQAELATAPFLVLNRDVMEQGPRLLGSVHSAFYRHGLSLISEWNYGNARYASPLLGTAADVPISAFYLTGAYFLTGEHVDRRAMVVPRRPLFPTRSDQQRGLGAWELVGRFSQLTLGRSLFDAGLADATRWANSASTYELGVNWYWNEYMKIYAFYLRGQFDDPVRYSPIDVRDSVDMFWLRFQLYY